MSMAEGSREGSFAWLGFLAVGLVNLGDGLIMAVFGATAEQGTIQNQLGVSLSELSGSDPAFAQYVNTLVTLIGLLLAGFALFVVVVSLTGYRRGHRWAWYAMWNPTVYYLLVALLLFTRGDFFTSDALSPEIMLGLLAATVTFQLVGYSSFFRRSEPAASAARKTGATPKG